MLRLRLVSVLALVTLSVWLLAALEVSRASAQTVSSTVTQPAGLTDTTISADCLTFPTTSTSTGPDADSLLALSQQVAANCATTVQEADSGISLETALLAGLIAFGTALLTVLSASTIKALWS